ncbi:hypothetical protein GGR50DRAFT_350540 [Xylaria sp. CBS 124048]|nr:hypothetical protein GGR50DRAFT_350540 [Xylaria sp. CBS 124048]
MCVRSHQQFSKCDHVATTSTRCPTFYQEQQRANGFLGCIFGRGAKGKKDCGRVVPHYLHNDGYCQACSVKRDQLHAQSVGQGALKIRRRDAVEERKHAARKALHKSERDGGHHRRKSSNHDVVHVETSVWLSDLYQNPETLAKKEPYAREAAAAPPVSSQPRKEGHHRSKKHSSKDQGRERRDKGETKKSTKQPSQPSQDQSEWMPSYGGEPPLKRPAKPAATYQSSNRLLTKRPTNRPPAIGVPPHSPPYDRARGSKRSERSERSDTSRNAQSGQKPNHVHESSDNPSTATCRIYLDTKAEAKPPTEPRQYIEPWGPKPYWTVEPSRWEKDKAAVSEWIDRRIRNCDQDSDVSFVCRTAKMYSECARK